MDEDLLELDAERQDARLQVLKAEQHREATFREFEHAKLAALEARFPSSSDTARYILAQLLTDGECLACGSEVPGVVQLLETRLTASQCVICGSQLPVPAESDGLAEISDERVTRTVSGLADADKALESARNRLDRADARYHETHHGLQEITTAIAKRRERIDALLRRLPKELADVHKQREELALLRQRLAILSEELSSSETGFSEFISGVRNSLVAKAPAIKEVFERYARDFLLEDCSLVWSERKERVGQSGFQVKFPTFELDMASATFASPVRRSGPDQVSESQREFIDLSFRIALMKAGDPELGGTLVVDAPEASLDAVFVHRAADVLSVFADPALENRLLITSNLTNGELIPKLLAGVSTGVMLNRIIDLFEIAEPTAAVREMGDEYARVRRKIFGRDQETGGRGPMSEAAALATATRRRQARILTLLDSATEAGLAPIGIIPFHAFAYLANVLAPVWDMPAMDGKILKRLGGPFYPVLQRDLDRLVGRGARPNLGGRSRSGSTGVGDGG